MNLITDYNVEPWLTTHTVRTHILHLIIAQGGMLPSIGAGRCDGNPSDLSWVISLLFFDFFLRVLWSRPKKSLSAFWLRHSRGWILKEPSSPLSSLLIRSATSTCLYCSFSSSGIAEVFCKATLRDSSFYNKNNNYNNYHQQHVVLYEPLP